jgi:hypothetical protein
MHPKGMIICGFVKKLCRGKRRGKDYMAEGTGMGFPSLYSFIKRSQSFFSTRIYTVFGHENAQKERIFVILCEF